MISFDISKKFSLNTPDITLTSCYRIVRSTQNISETSYYASFFYSIIMGVCFSFSNLHTAALITHPDKHIYD